MTHKIFSSILGACICVLLVAVAGTVCVIYNAFYQEQVSQLKSQAQMAARLLNADRNLPVELFDTAGIRLSVIEADGTVSYDSMEDLSQMKNHINREEIVQAHKTGEGFSLRRSDTLSEDTYNEAVALDDGRYIRLSKSHSSLLQLFGEALLPMGGFILFALFLSWWIARRAARIIMAPINAIDPSNPLKKVPYEQLLPLQTKLAENQEQIRRQMADLEQKSREFDVLSANMDEGLLLAKVDGTLVFVNKAARSLFGLRTGDSLKESEPLEKIWKKVLRKHNTTKTLKIDSSTYVLEAALIESQRHIEGVMILVLDITEKEEAQSRRQEFTANVTHELKTPLQTILSSSELIQNQIVTGEDIPVFAGYIHEEAARMTRMINDIIHLSRLDHDTNAIDEVVDFTAVVNNCIAQVRSNAALNQISLRVSAEPVFVLAHKANLEDIVVNLVENAIHYNFPEGYVEVSLVDRAGKAILKVKDNGAGIAPAIQGRIFERFFTADPSHNRKGTGLGLAIVKHAVENLKGTITLESTENVGSCFTVVLPSCRPDEHPPE